MASRALFPALALNVTVLFAVSINILFGLLKVINSLKIEYFYLYSARIVAVSVFSASVDFWIWLGSSVFVLAVLLAQVLRYHVFPRWSVWLSLLMLAILPVVLVREDLTVYPAILLGIGIDGVLLFYGLPNSSRRTKVCCLILFCMGEFMVFEVGSLSAWLSNVISYDIPFGSAWKWKFATFDLQIFNVFYGLTACLFLIFLYSWLWIPAAKRFLLRPRVAKSSFFDEFQKMPLDAVHLPRKVVFLALVGLMGLAAFVSYYPYFHVPPSTLTGIDSIYYYDWLNEMRSTGGSFAFHTDRPISNLFWYSIQVVSGSTPEAVVRIMPVVCAVGLALVVCWFVWEGTQSWILGLTSALFSVFSFQTVGGTFINSISNWLAVIGAFVLFALFLRSYKENGFGYIVSAVLVGWAVLLTHPVTWIFVMAAGGSYFVFAVYNSFVKKNSEEGGASLKVGLILGANLVFYVAYSLTQYGRYLVGAWEGTVSQGELSVTNIIQNLNFFSSQNLLTGLQNSIQAWAGGVFGNSLMVFLAIAGMLAIVSYSNRFRRVLVCWVLVPSLALFVGSPETAFFYRVLYVIPFQIFAAFGFFWIFDRIDRSMKFSDNRAFQILKIVTFALVVLFLLNYAVRSVDGSPWQVLT